MRNSLLVKVGVGLLLVSLAGCGSGGTNVASQTGSVTAQLQWIEGPNSSAISSLGKQSAAAPQGVFTVRIVVSAPGMPNIQKDFPAAAGTGVIDGVLAGSNRILTAQGLNASGVVTHQGVKENITVQAGQVTDAGIIIMVPIAPETFAVSGKVTSDGVGLGGVTVTLSGSGFPSTTTASDGTFTFTAVQNGSYTVTPFKTGYAFTPTNRSVTVSNGDVTGQDFTATLVPALHAISGTITLNGSGLSGVTVFLTGISSNSFTTGADGTYTFTGVQNGLYAVIPSKAGYAFTPANRSVSVNNSDVTGQDFAAAATALPSGFPSNVPTGNYRIDVQVCVQTPQGNSCQPVVVGIDPIANADINQFAQDLLNALNTASASSCSQTPGVQCTFTISYTPWNGTSFTITDTFTITTANSTASGTITFTVTKI
jgi:hypothetical protein